jgi:hypothetical protein
MSLQQWLTLLVLCFRRTFWKRTFVTNLVYDCGHPIQLIVAFPQARRMFTHRMTLSREPALPPTFRRNQRFSRLWPSLLPFRLQFLMLRAEARIQRMLGIDTILVRVRHSFQCRATVPRYCAPHAARHPLRVPSARTYSSCASRLGRVVLSDSSPPRQLRLSPEEASTLRLSTVAPNALLGVAHSIQLCLLDVLDQLDQHRLVEMTSQQHVAGMEEELSAASQRADALQALVVASDTAAVRLERRVDQLDRMLRDQLLLTDRLSGECRDLQLARLVQPQRIQPKALIKHRSSEDFNFATATMLERLLQKCQ